MNPKFITVHCSATPPTKPHIGAAYIREMHLDKGWSDIGYHFVISRDGHWLPGRSITKQGAGVKGHNKDNLHICLVGGVDCDGNAEFNYTREQMSTLRYRLTDLASIYGIKQENIKGHRDWFGDSNGDGVIDSRDWMKECPCFDVQSKLEEWKA